MSTILPPRSAHDLLAALLSGTLSRSESEEYFLALVSQPISAEILLDCVKVLRKKMVPVSLCADAIDTAGTGGSGLSTINTSTLTAFIVAAAGGKVAKHGNRSASGNCGCFDLLEELGVNIHLDPAQERRIFERLGIVFLFAPLHHLPLRLLATLRKSYGEKTLFNLMGPLCNPAGVTRQMIGTGNDADAQLIAKTLHALGSFGSIVVTGHDGLDEVTVTAATTVRHISENGVRTKEFSPASLSLPPAFPFEIIGGNARENVQLFLELAQGKGTAAMENLVLLNAAHALILAKLSPSIQEAFLLAREILASGSVHRLFERYREFTHQS
ncbi:anthranilate phosphoribosyltransferase [Candidatus Peregrinibacteria bacterium]|nr:anthranilate phosphoribosyltransferase [Candidatus Peregrinibacteria bacterium]